MKDEIILNNTGLIYKAMKELHCQIRTEEEFEQYYYAGLFTLIKALKTYDETKGKSGYLYVAIKNAIKREFYLNSMQKRNKMPISLNTEINDTEIQDLICSDYDLEHEVLTRLEIEEILDKLKSKRYKTFLLEYYGIGTRPLKQREIALKYGVTHQFVNNSIKYALQRIKKILKENK